MKNVQLSTLGVFVVTMAISANAQFSVLYNFGTNKGDPLNPQYEGLIAQGPDANLYSTTPNGGSQSAGAVFRITPSGDLTVLYNFDGVNSGEPYGGLTLAEDGNFYGTANSGGTTGFGIVFNVTPSGNLTVLYNFGGTSDGASPTAPPIQGPDGNLYGTTVYGGAGFYGTVYKITPDGKFTSLHQFNLSDGYRPEAPLLAGSDGNFYGTTESGGSNNLGTIFKITSTGNFKVLYNFDSVHGANPIGGLVQASDGNFYGTTNLGGASSSGVVFKMTPTGVVTVVYSFNGTTDGGTPLAGLVQATDGNFYGANYSDYGTIFEITPGGLFSVLYTFDVSTGANPEVTPMQHTEGELFGDSSGGGSGSGGTFYSFGLGLRPFVRLVSTAGWFHQTIGILGQGFTGTTGVSFNGATAKFNVVSDTFLTASVPIRATTGPVTVVTPSGTLTSNQLFRIVATAIARP
jgi:uncharacterized repeat protein (TIGR03803 family)